MPVHGVVFLGPVLPFLFPEEEVALGDSKQPCVSLLVSGWAGTQIQGLL